MTYRGVCHLRGVLHQSDARRVREHRSAVYQGNAVLLDYFHHLILVDHDGVAVTVF
jgi:hypothetical protein